MSGALLSRLAGRLPLILGGAITACIIGTALVSQVWTPEAPTRMRFALKLKGPLAQGLLGTDHFGRDLTSMLMVGAWNSLSIAVLAVLLGAMAGTLLGVTAAARAGIIDGAIMRLCDILFAFPAVLSAIMLGALMGPGALTAVVAIGVFMIPVFARVTRSAAAQVWARDYVLAARAAGKGAARITLEHVLPNIAGQIIVQVTIQLGLAILTEAGLSFLGLGIAPPAPSWGRMLADAQTYLTAAPHLALVPGIAIALSVLGFNLLGDGLRDLIDPRRRLAA
ncbi:ABC transporter permease [Azorhizobium doebereinerae]|uniref:ABC transporter permease n=1 Tax=Azorhizobium doebereinerae TaxID=281091 RepID=UPI000408A1FE|nr:ABC transporter permease [Azorhizobium doebereinerae]